MYTDWFKLRKLPFRLRPDPEFLFLGGETGLAYESLRAAPAGAQHLVVLAGDEELLRQLAGIAASGTAMPKPVTLRLARLTRTQIAEYLMHRLRIAGNDGREMFEPDTMADILRYTGGVPQLINTLCDS